MRAALRAATACRRSEASTTQRAPRALPRPITRLLLRLAVSRVDVAVGRVVHTQDFERLMQTPARKRSAHFAVHHVCAKPHSAGHVATAPKANNLSTDHQRNCPESVDDAPDGVEPAGLWLGCVVPKRHARRAVTRNLIKRQMRSATQRHAELLVPGLWLLRLHRPFDPKHFVSAASRALKEAARLELDDLLLSVTRVWPEVRK